MVKDDNLSPCWQHSTWQSPNLNYMSAPVEPRQHENLPACANTGTCMLSANMALPEITLSGLPGLRTGQTNEAHGLFQCWPPHIQTLLHTAHPYPKEKLFAFSHGLGGKATPNGTSGSIPKRFLIFDHSGNQTRLVSNSTYPLAPKPIAPTTNPFYARELNDEEQAANRDKIYPTKSIMHKELGENQIIGEGSEMHEDTEEINALLYSDDDDDDDEEISTGHSPIGAKGSNEKQEQVEVITEEVASSDGPIKRLRLLNGGYNKSSLMDTASSVKPGGSYGCDDDAESSYAEGKTQGEEMGSILGKKRSRQDKIRETLRILESIIPGGKGKDPLLFLDEAINYVISLKPEAKAQGAFHR